MATSRSFSFLFFQLEQWAADKKFGLLTRDIFI